MPTYSYRCTECGNAFDVQQSFSDDSLTVCPSCGGRLRKLYGSVGVTFNGSGFYRTDSRSEGTGGAKTDAASGGSGDSGSSSSSDSGSKGGSSGSGSSGSGSGSGGSGGSSSGASGSNGSSTSGSSASVA